MNYKDKIYPEINNDAINRIRKWKSEEKKIVFTNGCFDILHSGHIRYLADAANLGDIFVLGLNSDKSVRRLKGKNRPVKSQECRADILAFMGDIDMVIIFDEDTPMKIINKIIPDILVKGGDWKEEDIIGSDIVLANGGEVKSLGFLQGYSSSIIIEKMSKK